MNMWNKLYAAAAHLRQNEDGSTVTEYVVLFLTIVLAVFGMLQIVAGQVTGIFANVGAAITNALGG